jgi:hypothetical protein
MTPMTIPEVDGWWDPGDPTYLGVWCEHEGIWHWHGRGDGHVTSHCGCPKSPLYSRGYIIREVGPLTREVERSHRRAPGRGRLTNCTTDRCRLAVD